MIIPVYNAKKYLPKAIRSLRKQTIPQNQIEILLIEDGSTDESPALCDRYAQRYDNVHVFHQLNAGVSSARNKGLEDAKGKYLAFLDADDWISADTLERVTTFFEEHYEETDVVGYPTMFCYPKGRKVIHQRDLLIKEDSIISCDNKDGISLTRLSVLVKNKRLNNEQFDPELHFHEDEDYLLQVLGEKGTFGYVKEACYYYRQETGGLTATASPADRLFDPAMQMYRRWMLKFRQSPVMSTYIQNCILGDFAWKLREEKLFPIQPEGTISEASAAQVRDLIVQIDDEIIMNNPMLDFRDRFFLLFLKKRSDQATDKDNKIYLFFTATQLEGNILTVIGMLTNGRHSYKDLQLSVVSGTTKKRVPIRIREFSWAEPYHGLTSTDGYDGFCEAIPWDSNEPVLFSAESSGKILEVQCCFGPDAISQKDRKKRSIKQRALFSAIHMGKLLCRNVRLYCTCEEEYQKDKNKDKRGVVKRYLVRERTTPSDIEKKNSGVVVFRSKRHRFLFLIAEEIVLGTPYDRYIPIYEKTYRTIRDGVSHQIFISPRD